ncbi:ornithine aminotransferase [Flavobacterium noncentrifugens]|uniref:Osmotically-inducible protein OsmY, contains BON domain n=1 Tax=Flavobacterium noncentrifugens TaxID=1128970 RepID=A0A1G8WZ42_9FLAO|nr:BON domain-containing protein [Flavobacterium noncentrifugens]GEP51084.1 ornithine aminotransferase [Flavobacterium noncentrifugens]SDJ82835.1 Osmotically-inducible protein OsmY, contains BON domain [Flavobacterium noncentrifugens]
MKSNEDLQKQVQDAIKWEPLLSAAEIGVTAKNGIITLSGNVDRYGKKNQAEHAAKQVEGVKGVIENILVQNSNWNKNGDNEIAEAILNAFKWNWNTLNDTIRVNVEDGWVTLSGTLEWQYQKEAARQAVSNLMGVKGVSNNIAIAPLSEIKVSKTVIMRALKSHVALDVSNISVEVSNNNILLDGTVDSWFQKELAAKIAWKAPGVQGVTNNLLVDPEVSKELKDEFSNNY